LLQSAEISRHFFTAGCMVTCTLFIIQNAIAKESQQTPSGLEIQDKGFLSSTTSPDFFNSIPRIMWHYQMNYAVSVSDIEFPYWDEADDGEGTKQKNAESVLSKKRFSHGYEFPLNPLQTARLGLSILQVKSENWKPKMLVTNPASLEWRSWGLGGDFYLVRQIGPSVFVEAGIQADYLFSGRLSQSSTQDSVRAVTAARSFSQSNGLRTSFGGGFGGYLIGPIALIVRLGGFVLETKFRDHPRPFRAQGFQLEVGADLALGRSELR
jgi:hypothetical protein